jgi:DNA-binding HxlR family transcriptional regulator
MNNKSYHHHCGIAYALDIVGERWTLLIIRELIAGPRRFTDLLRGLPGISSNLLSERLKRLEQQGLLNRRILPPPAGSTVYELTSLGQALEKTMIELEKWGSQFVPTSLEDDSLLSVGSLALTLKTLFRPELALDVNKIYELHLDHEVLQIHINSGELQVRQGEALHADIVFYTEMPTYLGLLTGQIKPGEAISGGLIRIEGDLTGDERFEDERFEDELGALSRFLNLWGCQFVQ